MASAGLAARIVTGRTSRRRFVAAAYTPTPLATARELHMGNRFGYGLTPALLKQMRNAGGPEAWFERQLTPGSVAESPRGAVVPTWFPTLQQTGAEVYAAERAGTRKNWEYARDLSNYSLLRRVYSRRSVLESMVELWSNHLHIESTHFPAFAQRPAYDAMIREHALGRYEDLLVAATLHPAMLIYLDNRRSVRNAPNENHGRELLELHTVGVRGGYTEAMVKDAAKILSGWTVVDNTWETVYDPARHTSGPVNVLGFTAANADADGRDLTVALLRHLARHPATAQRVARKLCVRFVEDDPSDALVSKVAAAYLSSGTDIKATLRALVGSSEFWASAGRKVRTPMDDLVATCRVLGVRVQQPANDRAFAHVMSWGLDTALVYQWPRPDGMPDVAEAWTSPTRMLSAWNQHWNLAGGWWPSEGVAYRRPAWFMPAKQVRFDRLVDHLSRKVLGRRSTARLLQACCEATDTAPGEIITRSHAIVQWKMVRLLGVLLDSPAHMSR